MKSLMLVLATLVIFGCGENSDDKEKNIEDPKETISQKQAISNVWVDLSTETEFLLDKLAIIGDKEPSEPGYCFDLGDVTGRSYLLGVSVESFIDLMTLTEEQASDLLYASKRLQIRLDSDSCGADVDFLEQNVRLMAQALRDGIQYAQ